MALADDVEKLAKNQAALQKNFLTLKKRLDTLEERMGIEEPEEPEEKPVKSKTPAKATKETSKPIENLGFKIFGTVGFLLILLGLVFFYNYAVDQGYIGITGRIALGVFFSLAILIAAEVFRRREYEKFSQLLTGGGLALLYFTFYAAYAFPEYRKHLGMSAPVDLLLLLIVMVIAVVLALRYDSMLLTCYAFLLGYLAPLLIGAVEPTGGLHVLLISTLILSIGMSVILWKKNWPLGIYPVVASYIIYMIAYFANNVVRYAPAGQIPDIVGPAFFYLFCFFLLFNVLSVLLQDNKSNTQNVTIAIINAMAFLGFGLGIVWRYFESMRGVFLVLVAAFFLGMTFIAKAREQRNMFETFFLLCITYVTIAVPVQLSKQWIAIAWAVEGLLLIRSGVRVDVKGIRVLGYISLGLALINLLFWGTGLAWGIRIVTFLIVIIAFYLSAYFLSLEEKTGAQEFMQSALVVIGSVLLTVMLAIEISDPRGMLEGLGVNAQRVLLSVAWAAEAVFFIIFGFIGRSAAFRIMGASLFGIVVVKILIMDLDNLDPIYRTLVTIVVGIIALSAAFAYIKNKDRIKAYLEEK